MPAGRYTESEELLARARRVVPGGVYGHQAPRMVVSGAYPSFFASGPAAMPFVTFAADVKFAGSRAFAAACATGGVYLAPYHNWFVSAAHQERDIDQVLDVTDAAFAAVRRAAA